MICQVPILPFFQRMWIALTSPECHQSSYILCVIKIGFEDNTLRGDENDRIAKHNDKEQAIADQ